MESAEGDAADLEKAKKAFGHLSAQVAERKEKERKWAEGVQPESAPAATAAGSSSRRSGAGGAAEVGGDEGTNFAMPEEGVEQPESSAADKTGNNSCTLELLSARKVLDCFGDGGIVLEFQQQIPDDPEVVRTDVAGKKKLASGKEIPEMSTVAVDYTVKFAKNKEVLWTTGGEPVTWVLDDCGIMTALEIIVQRMREGERVTAFVAGEWAKGGLSPSGQPLLRGVDIIVEVCLVSVKVPESGEGGALGLEERVAFADSRRARGNELLKLGESGRAIRRYKEGIEMLLKHKLRREGFGGVGGGLEEGSWRGLSAEELGLQGGADKNIGADATAAPASATAPKDGGRSPSEAKMPESATNKVPESVDKVGELDEYGSLLGVLRLNCAQALLKQGEVVALREAEELCSAVLETEAENVKALYRRSAVRVKQGEWKLAKGDLAKLVGLEPTNALFRKELREVSEKLKKSQEKERKKFRNFFAAEDGSAEFLQGKEAEVGKGGEQQAVKGKAAVGEKEVVGEKLGESATAGVGKERSVEATRSSAKKERETLLPKEGEEEGKPSCGSSGSGEESVLADLDADLGVPQAVPKFMSNFVDPSEVPEVDYDVPAFLKRNRGVDKK